MNATTMALALVTLAIMSLVFGGGYKAGREMLKEDWRKRIERGEWMDLEEVRILYVFHGIPLF